MSGQVATKGNKTGNKKAWGEVVKGSQEIKRYTATPWGKGFGGRERE